MITSNLVKRDVMISIHYQYIQYNLPMTGLRPVPLSVVLPSPCLEDCHRAWKSALQDLHGSTCSLYRANSKSIAKESFYYTPPSFSCHILSPILNDGNLCLANVIAASIITYISEYICIKYDARRKS